MRIQIKTTWTYGICETCSKNSHEINEMVRERVVSGDVEGRCSAEVWVCPVCGASKKA